MHDTLVLIIIVDLVPGDVPMVAGRPAVIAVHIGIGHAVDIRIDRFGRGFHVVIVGPAGRGRLLSVVVGIAVAP